MDRETAEKLMIAFDAIGKTMSVAAIIIEDCDNVIDLQSIRSSLGALMSDLYIHLQQPIIEVYPDLDPDTIGSTSSSVDIPNQR